MEVTGRDPVADLAADEWRQILSAIHALSGVALLIAALGMINTLALAVLERTREIGVSARSAPTAGSCDAPRSRKA